MTERRANDQAQSIGLPGERASPAAILSLLTGALTWGLIWYPYRLLRDAGIDGIVASTASYAIAFALGLFFFRRSFVGFRPTTIMLWLMLASGGWNLGYVLATLNGEVVRVLLLFYLAPLWTVLLSRWLLAEQLNRFGAFVIALSLTGAATMLWQPSAGLPIPRGLADWLGLGAGFSFALFNVLSRRAKGIDIEIKSMVAFAGVISVGVVLSLAGIGTLPASVAPSGWVLLAVLGTVLLMVNLVVQWGIARVAANRAIVIMLSEVGFAALSAWLLAGEMIGPREWTGGAMIVAASLFSAKMET